MWKQIAKCLFVRNPIDYLIQHSRQCEMVCCAKLWQTIHSANDASDHGIGAVLCQIDEKGEEHPIQYISRKLLPRECNYPTVERECLAIVWAVGTLNPYLYGREFTVQTDHNPLIWLDSISSKNRRLIRWSLTLQEYQIKIVHKRGVENGNADALSRMWHSGVR